MTADGLDDDAIATILRTTRGIAVVGASANPQRPSFGVAACLVAQGYQVTPVNPGLAGQVLHGRRVAATLQDAASAAPLDMVDIFRRGEEVGAVVDEAIRLGAKTIWLQLGIVNHAAATRAREAGLAVVMDRCPKIEAPRLGVPGPASP